MQRLSIGIDDELFMRFLQRTLEENDAAAAAVDATRPPKPTREDAATYGVAWHNERMLLHQRWKPLTISVATTKRTIIETALRAYLDHPITTQGK